MIKNPKIKGVPLEKWLEDATQGVDTISFNPQEVPEALKLLGEMWKEHKQLRRFIQEDLGYTLRGWRQSEGKAQKPYEKPPSDYSFAGPRDV